MKPRCADLFCGAGGAAMGLHRAGFEVEGWDVKQSLSYPFTRHIGDAMEADLAGFDFVWASPPCQKYCALAHLHPQNEYPDLIAGIRDKLLKWGGPWIIENVPGAPLVNSVQLCGSSFGLQVRRHRIFESNLPIFGTKCRHDLQPEPIDVSGTGMAQHSERKKKTGGKCRKPENLGHCRQVMGMPWASRKEIAQAIPPAYSEFLGRQVLQLMHRD